jgi:capsular polysaccharide transport system permease protein
MKLFINKMLRYITSVNKLFLLTVAMPTLLAFIYYGFYATDIFISESMFVLRAPQKQSQSGFVGALLQGTGFSRSQDDAYSVHDFIKSRDALTNLDKSLKVKGTYSNPTVDIINRFAGIDGDDSFEAFHKYYQKYVAIEYDTSSSITVLKTRAFNAKDAYLMNVELLDMSEKLVNQLNDRGRQDLVSYAEKEVDEAERKAKNAALAVSKFRSKNTVVDPEKQSAQQLIAVGKLQEELITTTNQLAQLKSLAPDNPQIPVLKVRMQYIQKAIDAETAKVAGNEKSSLTNKAANYERLSLEREFADKNLAYALTSLTSAKNEAQRQQLYLERLVQPSLPDIAVEPRRIRSIISILMLGLVAWGVLSMLLAGVREHQD